MDKNLNVIIATDCGSTTTKAILIEKVGDIYRQTYRGEAPTTVEAPFEDVTKGVLNAIAEIEELSGRKILDGMAGLWNVNAGYGREELAKAAYDQMKEMAFTSNFSGMTNSVY